MADFQGISSIPLKNLGSEGRNNLPNQTLNTDEADMLQATEALTPDQHLNIQENTRKRKAKVGQRSSENKYWSFVNRRQQQQAIY
mmetsp:Transcript_26322/g.40172  ORF Transcript_26322/g.40172 Transcript_26322/m.40172 type:complete len:85 (-) Transcript_26322:704-958(-)